MTGSINCDNCGTQLKFGSSFCGSCGASVRQSQDAGNQDADVTRTPNLLANEDQQSGGVRMTTVRRVGVLRTGIVSGLVFLLITLFFCSFVSLWLLFNEGPLEAIGVLIGFPLFYGVLGFLGGLLYAWVYNVVAGWVGGIKIELS